jgi:hypothetical protein
MSSLNAMKRISPIQFSEAFTSVVEEKREALVSRWWENTSEFTRFMKADVLQGTAEKLSLRNYPFDYYTIDTIFFEEFDFDHFSPDTSYAKYIAVAIEHENQAQSSCCELNKLQLINTPLKVLITYARSDDERRGLIVRYEKIIKAGDCFDDVATHRKQLVIFGDMPDSVPEWRFLVYDGRNLVALPLGTL